MTKIGRSEDKILIIIDEALSVDNGEIGKMCWREFLVV